MPDTTPRLPVTVEASAPYAPFSYYAIAAIGTAGFFAFILILLGISAWLAGQPLFEPVLLLIPIVALVLAFAGRRHVMNSEGTRVGLPLCNLAWWIAVICGFGYLAYLIGIGFAIRSDAEDAFQRWAANLVKVNPLDPRNVDLAAAFHGTLSPDKQGTILANDTNKLFSLHGASLLAFRQSDLVRVVFRNAKDVKFDVVGLEEWKNEANSLVCRLTVHVNCPEGEFTISLPMQKQTLKGQSVPTWQVIPPQNEQTMFFKHDKPPRLSAYGERIRDMEIAAQQLVYAYFLRAVANRADQPRLFEIFGTPQGDPGKTMATLHSEALNRLIIAGGFGWERPEPRDAYREIAQRHFVSLDKGDAAREEDDRRQFIQCWKGGFFATPTAIIQKNPEVSTILVPRESSWEVRVPIEIQAPGAERSQSARRGVVVCVVDDQAFMKELADLKSQAGTLHIATPRFNPEKPVPWKINRIESDMKIVLPPKPQPGSGGP